MTDAETMTDDVPTPRWADRLELGEGIRWTDGRLVLVDILAGRLLEAPGESGTGPAPASTSAPAALRLLAELPVPLGVVAPVAGRPGTWIAAAGTGICLIAPDGTLDWLARPEDDTPAHSRMNDGTADPHGRFWAGSMAYDATEDAGSLYRVDPGGTVTRVLDRITVPNGPAFTADGTAMYLADSARGVIRRYPVDPGTGTLGAPEPFAYVEDASPDGMTVDQQGRLWVAIWGGGAVHRYLPDGTLDRVVPVPAIQPAGVCLGGPDGRTLHITSARIGLDAPGPLDGAVFTLRVDTPGLPTMPFRPAGPG
ncbi:SMP-30/gluconolactonase/LRE family protein [Streptomyces sp. 8N616]|uniref:SMP-30/gluconolactonase/LRE family protein n=1 Tax=Streptomyces sp. 8N616 TaxID=3457414 RepID=UPI003FD5D476